MPETALQKVKDRVAVLIRSIDGLHVSIDRSDAEPLHEGEWPAASVRVPSVQFEPGGQETYGLRYQILHRATFHIDCQSGSKVGETINEVNQQTIASIIGVIAPDPTMGGMVESMEPQAMSGSELDGADIGCAILEIQVVFYTPSDDLFTLVGMNGDGSYYVPILGQVMSGDYENLFGMAVSGNYQRLSGMLG